MRYDDASQGSVADHVSAHDDTAHLAGNDYGQTTGNLITGVGTASGVAGADVSGPGAHITAISGAGGSDTTFDAQGHLQVAGQYGTLTIDANGNYAYARNAGSPEGVSDTFTYTLADAAGSSDQAKLVIAIGNPPILNAQGSQTIQTANGAIVLPAGVELSDVHVEGRNLVITLPDGSTMVIPDGAVFVPQLVVNGVEVPASNLAALLIDSEPKPAAGDQSPNQLSSGGNFEVPVAPLDPGVPLGDLIPPTELNYIPPEFKDIFPDEHNQAPSIGISSVNVSDEGVSTISTPIPDSSGNPDTTNLRINSGVLPVSDPDGDALVVTLDTAGLPTDLKSHGVTIAWSLSGDGQTITGSAGATTVITIHIDNIQADGAHYTVTQSQPIDHPVANSEDGVSFVVSASVSDGQETTVGGAITVTIEDDSPVVSGVQARGGVTLDETNAVPGGFPISDTSSTSVIVNSTGGFGADGPAATGSITYGLSLTGGVSSLASGIVTAVGDFPITLVQTDSATIQGQYTNGGTQVAFVVHMNANGTVTLTQNVALEHNVDGPPGPAHDDSLSLNGLVNATVIYKDFDLDTASGSAPIGGSLIFKDDGPSAAVNPQAALDTLVLDETRPVGSDTSGAGSPSGLASVTANFADNFVTPIHYGADGAGSVAYALSLSANGIGSGLYALDASDTTAGDGDGIGQGAQITLSQSGNTITGSAGGTNYFTISIDSNTGVVTFTQLHAIWNPTPGSSYDESAGLNTESAANVSVVQTVTDSDGDTATASLGIGRGVFSIQDDGPTAALNVQAALDTIVLDESSPNGTDTAGAGAPSGLNSATANFGDNFASVANYGADGPGSASYALHLSAASVASGLYALDASDTTAGDGDGIGQGAQIMLSQVGNTITGSAGGTDYFTISIDSNTGVVTFTQLHAVWNPTPGSSYDEAANLSTAAAADVQVVQTLTDADGDTSSVALNIGQGVFSIQDDGPVAAVNPQATLDTIVLDESSPNGTDTAGAGAPAGLNSATANFGDNFAAVTDYGSDGPGHASYQLLLSSNGIGSGLYALDATDTVLDADGIGQGAEITLSQAVPGGTITGSAGGTNYFTISIDSNTGVVTFTQLSPIWHSNTGSFDEAAALNTAAAANVQVQQTLTDADGDTSSATVNVGQGVFSIQDDGPVSSVNGQAALDTIVLDESRPVTTDTSGANAPAGLDTATANFADNFNGPTDYGSDGPGHTSYALHLSASSVGSGLYALQPSDTALVGVDGDGFGQGAQIMMTQAGNVITGSAGGVDYFTISINASTGVVTFTQLQPIWNPTPGTGVNYDEAALLSTAAPADLQVVQSVTDADGDTASSSLNIGQGVFSIQDDGPAAVNDGNLATLNDSASGVNLGAVDSVLLGNDDFGSDGPAGNHGAITFSAGSLGGSVSVDGSGNLIYTSNHDTLPGNTDVETFTYTVRDADGDTTTATFTVSLTESAPTIQPTSFSVDEEGLANGIAGTIYVDGSDLAGTSTTASGTLSGFSYGGDGKGATGNIVLAASADTGLRTLSNHVVATVWDGATHTLTGFDDVNGNGAKDVGDNAVFTLQITDVNTGAYSFNLLQPVKHTVADSEDDKSFSVNVTVTDSDGDPASSTINITIDDDSPQVSNVNGGASVTLDETNAAAGNVPGSFPISVSSLTPVITATTAFGADGQAAANATVYGLSLAGGVNTIGSGLQTAVGNLDITLNLVDAQHITGTYNAGANTAFTITMNNDGTITVQQNVPLEHLVDGPSASDHNDALDLVLDGGALTNLVNATITITDGDGDHASGSTPIGDQIIFLDDGPAISASAASISVDEEGLAGGVAGTVYVDGSDLAGVATTASGTLAGFKYGADGAGNIVLAASADTGLRTLSNHVVASVWDGATHTLTGFDDVNGNGVKDAGDNAVFTLQIDNLSTGHYVFNLLQPVKHATANTEDNATFNVGVTVTDSDDDTALGTISILIDDDSPDAVNDGSKGSYDDNVSNVNIGTVASILSNDFYGADGPNAGTSIAIGTGSLGGTISIVGGNLMYTSHHNVVPGGSELETFTYTITDGDGDTDTATFTVTLTDTGPTIDATAATINVDEEGLAGGLAGTSYGDGSDLAGTAITASGNLSGLTFGVDTPGNIVLTAVADTGLRTLSNHVIATVWDGATHTLTGFDDVNGNGIKDVGDNAVFTLQIDNVSTGHYVFNLLQPVKHATANTEDNATFNVGVTVTDAENDPATGSISILIDDDSPTVTATGALEPTLQVDESNFGGNAGPTSFAGLFNFAYGADGQNAVNPVVYSLGISGGSTGLTDTATNQAVLLKVTSGVVHGYVTISGVDTDVFTISVNSSGEVTFDQLRAIVHPNTNDSNDDKTFLADNLITLNATITDGDGDTATLGTPISIAQDFHILDDGPSITNVSDPVTVPNSGATPTATGNFVYSVGADINSDFDDISVAGFTVSVNGTPIAPANVHLTEGTEDAHTANYSFTFDYNTGLGGNTTATGTLIFYKDNTVAGHAAGTYQVVLTNGPVQGFTLASTGGAGVADFVGYDAPGFAGGSKEIQNVHIGDNLFIQFTSGDVPNNGTFQTTNFTAITPAPPAEVPPDPNTLWATGDLFTDNDAVAEAVIASSSAIGASGNTLQNEELIDFNLYNSDPLGTVGTPTTHQGEMFMVFDQISSVDDLIIVLKLVDTQTGVYTTKTLIVDAADLYTNSVADKALLVGTPYEGISNTLDNTDGLLIVQPNDYNSAGQHWEIVGGQVLVSPTDVTGTGIDFNRGLGAGGGSSGTQLFTTDTDTGGAKIMSIGFLVPTTTAQQATIEFDTTVTDGDGDHVTQNDITVNFGAPPPPVVLDLNGDGVHFLGQSAGVHYDYGAGLVTTAWAAADDGILVRDANHNGNVDNASEFVFGGNGVTDMQALHAQYGDQLDANDADFTMFAVWNDANSNGVVDANELHSLAEAGITSIGLVSDGIAYNAANGDVHVAGTSSYTKADGSTGAAADASFSIGSAAKATQEVERVAANSNSVALAAAVAAAGVAASSAAAASTPSFGFHEAAISAAIVGKVAYTGDSAFDTGSHFSALSALSTGGFEANALQMASTSHTAIAASHVGELTSALSFGSGAPTALLDATDFSNIMSTQTMPVGMSVAMPTMHGLVAGASGIEAQVSALNVQHAGVVEQIVADALHGGTAGQDINALLNVLPGAGLGEVAGLHGLASPVGADVSTWDTGHHGDFTFDVANIMTNPAMVLHHDAVQPVANG